MKYLLLIPILTILIIIFVILNPKKSNILKFKVSKKFLKDFNPKENEEVKLWYNNKNNSINIYLKGTTSGNGKIGEIKDKFIINKFDNDEIYAIIKNINNNEISIEFKNYETN